MFIRTVNKKLIEKTVSGIAVLTLFTSVSIFSSGCTIKVPMAPDVGKIEIKDKLPVEAGLLISEETRNYVYRGHPESLIGALDSYEFPLGEALEETSKQAFSQVFKKIDLVRTSQEAMKYGIIIEPQIEDFHFRRAGSFFIPSTHHNLSKIKVHVTLASGESEIWGKSIESPEQKIKEIPLATYKAFRDTKVINAVPVGYAASEALVFTLRKIALEISEDTSVRQFINKQGDQWKAAREETGPPVDIYDYEVSDSVPSADRAKRTIVPPTSAARGMLRFHLGSFDAEENPGKLYNERHRGTWGAGLSFKLPKTEHFSFDVEFWETSRKYDNTAITCCFPLGTIDDHITLNTSALLFGVRAIYPLGSRFRIYGAGGVGQYKSKLILEGTMSGTRGTLVEEANSSAGHYFGGGLETFVSYNVAIGVNYRRWVVEGSFDKFGLNNVDIGGEYTGISIGLQF
ncbi:MAG TPA: hypothetical protein ENI12_05360 [Nitrospirae bacterium]|nr:hypothetical protein [Nitrospirota bacterium]